jgi:hypothetical protein
VIAGIQVWDAISVLVGKVRAVHLDVDLREVMVYNFFCDPEGYQTYKAAMSNSGQSG